MSVIERIKSQAKTKVMHIVLAEGSEPRTVQAAAKIVAEGLAKITLVGNPDEIQKVAAQTGTDLRDVAIVDPATCGKSEAYAEKLCELRQKKGMTIEQARELVTKNNLYLGCMIIKTGDADIHTENAAAVIDLIHGAGHGSEVRIDIVDIDVDHVIPGKTCGFVEIIDLNEIRQNAGAVANDIGKGHDPIGLIHIEGCELLPCSVYIDDRVQGGSVRSFQPFDTLYIRRCSQCLLRIIHICDCCELGCFRLYGW